MTTIDPFEQEEYNKRWMERALARVNQNGDGCWIWGGPKQRRGYGLQTHRYFGSHHVHRILYQLAYGQRLGRWDYVCHACDVPSCVNPAQLIGISERTMRRCIAGEIRLIEPAAMALQALTQ